LHPQATFQTQFVAPISASSFAEIGNYTFAGTNEVGHYFALNTKSAADPAYKRASIYTMVSPQLAVPHEETTCYAFKPQGAAGKNAQKYAVAAAATPFTEAQFVTLISKVSTAFAKGPVKTMDSFFSQTSIAVLKHHTFWHGDVAQIFESLKAQGGAELIVNVNKATVGGVGGAFSVFECHYAVRKQAIVGAIVSEGHAVFVVGADGLIVFMMINKQCDDK